MYEIRPESLKTFIEDKSIKLPRFQRKQTWDDKKNFELCISIFKGFPLGVVVINKELGKLSRNKWLLDGRQRRTAFINMMNDPEMIYDWAKKFIKFKNSDQPDVIKEKFLAKIEEHLGEDEIKSDSNEEINDKAEQVEPSEEVALLEDICEVEDEISSAVNNSDTKDLDILLRIILCCHNKNSKSSGFTRPFDLTKFIDNLEYCDRGTNGENHLNSKKLRTWMKGFVSFCEDNDLNYNPPNTITFHEYITKRYKYDDNEKKLFKHIEKWWSSIIERFELVGLIDTIIQETKIGFIELSDVDANSAQTIFKIINNGGTPLTAVEVLSAKPAWNSEIRNPSIDLSDKVKILYEEMGFVPENVVRWDIPATLMDRLESLNFVFKQLNYKEKSEFEKKITLGFKLMSAIYQKGITKNHIAALSENEKIKWEGEPDRLIYDLNLMGKILCNDIFYKFINSWNCNIMDLTSDAIGINFLITTYMDWIRKGKPVGNSTQTKVFIKNSIITLDTLIFEYVNKLWRGSSDSRIADNITKLDSKPELFNSISKEKWKELITDIIDKHEINDSPLRTDSIDEVLKPILYYYYILKRQSGPSDIDVSIEIDHIIPKSKLSPSKLTDKEIKVHNLFNLALLPRKDNNTKRDKKLREILDDPWLVQQVEKYAEVPESDFIKYSDISNIDELRELRKSKFISVFTDKRDEILNN